MLYTSCESAVATQEKKKLLKIEEVADIKWILQMKPIGLIEELEGRKPGNWRMQRWSLGFGLDGTIYWHGKDLRMKEEIQYHLSGIG